MGSNDIPPTNVPAHVVPVCNLLLQLGGALWTVCYALFALESLRSNSYGMPLLALALNFAWELVYALYVAESRLEQTVFMFWLVLDCAMVYALTKTAKVEWSHSPWVARNIITIFTIMTATATVGHWTFAKWWIDNDIGKREGKFYKGVIGPDTTELGFWSAAVCQLILSTASLCQLLVRQHSRGVSWSIWTTRTLGSIFGLYLNYAWAWYFWTEAHEYFMSPFAIFLWATSLICDVMYGYALWHVRRFEKFVKKE